MNLAELYKVPGVVVRPDRLPKHIAFSFESERPAEDYAQVRRVAMIGFGCKIPVLSFSLMPADIHDSERFSVLVDEIERFFQTLAQWDYLPKHQVKVTVLGHWYDLPGRAVDAIKRVLEETKDFDQFFLTLCVNYDGQDEIVDACKLIARQCLAGKAALESISREQVKENLSSSYFIPPGVICRFGTSESGSLLLWDSPTAIRVQCGGWLDYDTEAFLRTLERYQREAYH